MPTTVETMNAKQAAERLGVHYITVLRWLDAGRIEGEKRSDGAWAIPVTVIEEKLAQERARAERYVRKTNEATVLRHAVNVRFYENLYAARKLAEEFVAACDDLDKLVDADPVVQRERVETLQNRIDTLRGALLTHEALRQILEDVMHEAADAAALGRGIELEGEMEDLKRAYYENTGKGRDDDG